MKFGLLALLLAAPSFASPDLSAEALLRDHLWREVRQAPSAFAGSAAVKTPDAGRAWTVSGTCVSRSTVSRHVAPNHAPASKATPTPRVR